MASDEQTTQSELMDMIRSELFKVQAGIMGRLEAVSADVKHLSHRLSMVEKSVESLQSAQTGKAAHADQTTMHSQQGLAAIVAFNNPLNIVFYGIAIHQYHLQQGMTLEAVFRNFMCEKLQIEQTRAFSMPIYVQYLPKMSREDVHHPLCVTFRSNKDKAHVTKRTEHHIHELRPSNIWAKSSFYTNTLQQCKGKQLPFHQATLNSMADEKQTIISELQNIKCEILRTQAEVMTKLDVLSKEMTHLTGRVSKVERSVEAIKNAQKNLSASIAHLSPLNVMFYGVSLNPEMTLDASFRNFLIEFLHGNPEKVQKMAVHVQYLPKVSEGDLYYPICVTFRANADRHYVCRKATKYGISLRKLGIWAGGIYSKDTMSWVSYEDSVMYSYYG